MQGNPKTFHSKIVGISNPNPDGSSRQKLAKRVQAGQRLELIREPKNPGDRNAIAVFARFGLFHRRKQLGYLSADLAREYARFMDKGGRIDAEVSEVTGGGWLWCKKSRGVNVQLTVHEPASQQAKQYKNFLDWVNCY
jgi:hypothetical protein